MELSDNKFDNELKEMGFVLLESSTKFYRFEEFFISVNWVYSDSGIKFVKGEDHFTNRATIPFTRLKQVIRLFDEKLGETAQCFTDVNELKEYIDEFRRTKTYEKNK